MLTWTNITVSSLYNVMYLNNLHINLLRSQHTIYLFFVLQCA